MASTLPGLGPWLLRVPEHVEDACSEASIDLLIIPDRVPFKNISRAFWGLAARGGRAHLMGSLGTQTALAQALDGWAAFLPADSSADTYWPATVQNLLPRLRAQTLRLNRTVCPLLAIKAREHQAAVSTAATFAASVAKLLLQGHPEAARTVAEDAGLQDLPPRVRILALQSEVDDAQASATLKAVLSEPVLLSEAAATVPVLRRALPRAPAGRVVSAADQEHARADEWVQALGAHTGVDLLATMVSYLRHRGHWENVARELALHRNSVRHRITIAESLLGVDLHDPDVAAPLWMALRQVADS